MNLTNKIIKEKKYIFNFSALLLKYLFLILVFLNILIKKSFSEDQIPTISSVITLLGHDGAVTNAVYSADGTRILTASTDGTARIWDSTTGELLQIFSGHDGAVTSANFSRDGKYVVTAGEDRTIRLWDIRSGDHLVTFRGHTNWIFSVSYSPDGRKIVSASADGTVRAWDISSNKPIITIPIHGGWAMSAVFSADSDKVIVGIQDGTVAVYNLYGGILRSFNPHNGMINDIALSRDGTRILTATVDNSARMWDFRTGEIRTAFYGHEGWVNSVAFSSDGSMVVTAAQDKSARIWDARTGKLIAVLSGHDRRLLRASFSPDGLRVVTASADGTAKIWPVDLSGETRQDNLMSFFESSAKILKKPRDIYFEALKAEALGKRNEARALYKDLIDRFKDDEYALKAAERLLALAP